MKTFTPNLDTGGSSGPYFSLQLWWRQSFSTHQDSTRASCWENTQRLFNYTCTPLSQAQQGAEHTGAINRSQKGVRATCLPQVTACTYSCKQTTAEWPLIMAVLRMAWPRNTAHAPTLCSHRHHKVCHLQECICLQGAMSHGHQHRSTNLGGQWGAGCGTLKWQSDKWV